MNLLKWWFNRRPYVPAILSDSRPAALNSALSTEADNVSDRLEKAAAKSRSLTNSVITMHGELLKALEGKRA